MTREERRNHRIIVLVCLAAVAAVITAYFVVRDARESHHAAYLKDHPEKASAACQVFSRKSFAKVFKHKASSTYAGPRQCAYDLGSTSTAVQITIACGDAAKDALSSLKTDDAKPLKGVGAGTFFAATGNASIKVHGTVINVMDNMHSSRRELMKIVRITHKAALRVSEDELCRQ